MRLIKEPFAIARGSRIRVDLISRILSVIDVGIIYLGSTLPPTCSGAPGAFCGTGRSTAPASPCSRWGFAWPSTLLSHAGALLPHPFTLASLIDAILLSVALAVRLPCPAVSRHRYPAECGLSSTGSRPAAIPSVNPDISLYSQIGVELLQALPARHLAAARSRAIATLNDPRRLGAKRALQP